MVARTIALARTVGSDDLKMPDPTKTASAPNCIISAASAGVARPPAEKFGTGSFCDPSGFTGRHVSGNPPLVLIVKTRFT